MSESLDVKEEDLDFAVAVEVLGWRSEWKDRHGFGFTTMRWLTPDGRELHNDLLPHFSEDMGSAWLVWCHIRDTDEGRLVDHFAHWLAVETNAFWDRDGELATRSMIERLSPASICRAAIKAVRMDPERPA